MKKGQITIFLILGVLLLGISGIWLFISSGTTTAKLDSQNNPAQVTSLADLAVENLVETCMKDNLKSATYIVAMHSGYLDADGWENYGESGDGTHFETKYYLQDIKLSYFLDGSSKQLRPRSDIEDTIRNYVLVELEDCLNLTFLEKEGYDYRTPQVNYSGIGFNLSKAKPIYSNKKVDAKVTIAANDVLMTLQYPIIIMKDDEKKIVESFSASVPLRLGLLYNYAQKLINNIVQDGTYNLREHCEDYESKDKMVNIYFYPNLYYKNYAYSIVDASPLKSKNPPLRLNFAIKNSNVTGECVG